MEGTMESTLIFIKPDGLEYLDKILSIIRRKNLDVKFLKEITATEKFVRLFYRQLSEEIIKKCISFFGGHILPFYIVSGRNAIIEVKIIKRQLRAIYGKGRTGSLFHSTNNISGFRQEMEIINKL